MREALLFAGNRRPSVRVVEHRKVFGRHRSGFLDESGESPTAVELVIETSGNGRPYQVKHAEGWWRDFSEVRIDDERTVIALPADARRSVRRAGAGSTDQHRPLGRPDQGAAAGRQCLDAGRRVRNR